MNRQPWIGAPATDSLFIISPPFVSLAIVALFPSFFGNGTGLGDIGWIVLILLVDVAHVYSTLFKTYFDKDEFSKRNVLLTAVPVIGFVISVLVYSMSDVLFWRALAYLAVFHFVRQQYGFMRLYSRNESHIQFQKNIDKLVIYCATIYPLIYWHFSGPRQFNWFIENDFIYFDNQLIINISFAVYLAIVTCWISKEIILLVKKRYFNIPKFLIICGTLLSWYFGIVYFNGDATFTFLNVVSHGIPYMALIYIMGKKKYRSTGDQGQSSFMKKVFSTYGIAIFLGVLFLFAFIEEGLWDIALWKEHDNIFGSHVFKDFTPSKQLLAIIVPLLALPQLTHYVLDGFIWRKPAQPGQ